MEQPRRAPEQPRRIARIVQGPFSSNVLLVEAVNSRRRVASHPRGVVLYYPLGVVIIEWWGFSEADEVIYTLN